VQKVALNAASDSAVTANKMATEQRNKKHPFVIILYCLLLKKQNRNLTKYSMHLLHNLDSKPNRVPTNVIYTLYKTNSH
jgi:hypothetical protein